MAIEEVLERATINFGSGLSATEIEKMLRYIALHSNYNVHYRIETEKRIRDFPGTGHQESRTLLTDVCKGMLVTGSISVPHVAGLFSFTCDSKTYDPPLAHEFQFTITPGYTLEEHRREEIVVWDKTRELIADYLVQRRGEKERARPGLLARVRLALYDR